MTHIKSLFRYPVKSLGRQSLTSVRLMDYGVEYDRYWMLVDENHKMVTQREIPELTNYNAAVTNGRLTISNKTTQATISIDIKEITDESVKTQVWGSHVNASNVSKQVNDWLSAELRTTLILVGAGNAFVRTKEIVNHSLPLKFSDGYPILVLSQASIDHLNEKLEYPINESRFRANIIIDDCPPHTEDIAKTIETEEARIDLIKPCKRCIVVCTNQETGEVLKEPLKTLASYRTKDQHVMFGVNARASMLGTLTVHDELTVSLQADN